MYRSANDDQNDGQKQKMRDGFKKDDVGSVAAQQQAEYQRSRHGDGQDDGLSHGGCREVKELWSSNTI